MNIDDQDDESFKESSSKNTFCGDSQICRIDHSFYYYFLFIVLKSKNLGGFQNRVNSSILYHFYLNGKFGFCSKGLVDEEKHRTLNFKIFQDQDGLIYKLISFYFVYLDLNNYKIQDV